MAKNINNNKVGKSDWTNIWERYKNNEISFQKDQALR